MTKQPQLPAAHMTKKQIDRERQILFPESRLLKFRRRYPQACCPAYFGVWRQPCERCLAAYKRLRVMSEAWLRIGAQLRDIRIDLLAWDEDLYANFVQGIEPEQLRARIAAIQAQQPGGLFAKRLRDLLNEIGAVEKTKFIPAAKIKLSDEEQRFLYGSAQLYEAQETADAAAQDTEIAKGGGVRISNDRGETFDRPAQIKATRGTAASEDTSGPDHDDYGEGSNP